MLTIANVGDNIGEYYATEDYYKNNEQPELLGQGVKAFEFDTTQLQHEQFMSLVGDIVGKTKKDGTYEEPLKAHDLTFSAPKSVSVLYGTAVLEGDTALSDAIKEAQQQAVKDTFRHLEESGMIQTKIKFEDERVEHYKAKDVVGEITQMHLTNRDGQTQLHNHLLLANKCHAEGDPSEKERSIYIKGIYDNQHYIDGVYKQYLAEKMHELGFEVEFSRGKKGQESFEIVGIDKITRDVWSRRPDIADHLMETRGKTLEQATAQERQQSTLATRKPKVNLTTEQLHEIWAKDRDETGISLSAIREASNEFRQQRDQEQAARLAEQQQQEFQHQQYQQQQYQQHQQTQQTEFQHRQQAERQAAQRAQEAAARNRVEAPKPTHTVTYTIHPSPTYDTAPTPDAVKRPENEYDYGGFSHGSLGGHGSHGTLSNDHPMVAARSIDDDVTLLPAGRDRLTGMDITAWEAGVVYEKPGYEGHQLPDNWGGMTRERRDELREIMDLPRPDHADARPMTWRPGMEQIHLPEGWGQATEQQREAWRGLVQITLDQPQHADMLANLKLHMYELPKNWLHMSEPAKQGWLRDQLSHSAGIAPEKTTAPAPEPQTPDWWTSRDWTPREAAEYDRLVQDFYTQHPAGTEQERYAYLRENWQPEVIDPKKEIVRQALQDCEDLRGVWTAQAAYNDARKAAIAQNISLDLDEFKKQFDAIRAEKGVVDLPGQDESWLSKRYTTQAVLDADRYIQHVARHENKYELKLIDPEQAKKYIDEFSAKLQTEKGYSLLSDQVNAIKHLAEHSDKLVTGIQGRAGTGKSTGVALLVADMVGREKVTSLSSAAAAAGKLGEAIEVDDAKTIAAFVKKYEKGDAATVAKLQDGIIILDEAGMTGSVEMAKVIKIAQENNARVILIGDTDQLAPVSAGCPFLELQERATEGVGMQTAELRQIVRQKDAAAREAVLHVVDGETKEALDYLIETNQIKEVKDKPARYKEIIELKTQGLVEDFAEGRDIASPSKEKSDYLTMVSTNAARDKINNGVRKSLQEQGALDKAQDRTFTVADKDGNKFEKKFTPGDHILFLQNDNNIGIHNSDLAQIQSIENSMVNAKLANGDMVSFDAEKYNRFDYGYALTTYKAQGATQRRAIYDADSKSPLLNKNEFYVGISRFTEEVHIFTDSKRKMANKIQKSQEKRSALAEFEKGQAREQGHKYVEAVEKAHETRKSADLETKDKQRRLTHSYQGDYKRVPREFRDMIDQEFESHRKQLSTELKAAKEKFGDKKDSVTKDMNKAVDKWHDNHEKIKADGIKAEAIAKKKGAITPEEKAAKKNAAPIPDWQRDYLARDPEARARAEQQKLVASARRSHQSLDTRLAGLHQANDKTFEKKLTEYTPRRQLADELKRREELAAAKSNDPVVAAKDRPAHLAAEAKAAAVFQSIREAETAQKEAVKQIAADQRAAKEAAAKAKQDFGPEQRKPFIQQYQTANTKFRESVKEAVTQHCDSPEAGQAIHDALGRWQKGQDGIKKASTQNVKQYIKVRDRKQPPPTKSELSAAKAEFEKGNKHVKKLYKANKAALDKTFTNIKTFIKEEELRKHYESQGRTPPEATVKPIRSKDQDGKETVSFRAPDQSQRPTRAEKEISDLVSEYRSLTDRPKNPFMKDLAQTRDAWEAGRRKINGDKAKELETLKEKSPDVRELDGERQKHYRDRHANATSLFKGRVEELVAKHGGDQATAKKIMDSLKSWESRKNTITNESRGLYREPSSKPRTPTPEEKTAIIAKYKDNDAKLDKDFDGIRKELDTLQKDKKKTKGKGKGKEVAKEETKEVGPEKAKSSSREKPKAPEKGAPDKADEFKNEKKERDPKAIAAAIDQAIRQDENKFFDELDAAQKHGVAVDIPERKTEVKGILVGSMKGKDGNKYAILATAPGKYSAVPANGNDIAAMMGKPVLAGRGGIAAQGEAQKGSSHINNYMLNRGAVAKQFGSKLGKLLQKSMGDDRGMELSL